MFYLSELNQFHSQIMPKSRDTSKLCKTGRAKVNSWLKAEGSQGDRGAEERLTKEWHKMQTIRQEVRKNKRNLGIM